MRKMLLGLLLFLSPLAFSQNPGVVIVGTAPAGSCPQGVPGQLVNSTGAIWTCQNIVAGTGTWTQAGGGGSGNVSYSGTPAATYCAFWSALSVVTGNSYCTIDSNGNIVSNSWTGMGADAHINLSSNTTHTSAAGDLFNNAGVLYYGTGAGTQTVVSPVNTTSTSNQFFTAYSNSTGAFTKAAATDAGLTVTDVTTNNVSTSAHGFAPKSPNDVTKFLDGTGAYSKPSFVVNSTTPGYQTVGSSTAYLFPCGNIGGGVTAVLRECVLPISGTISNLSVALCTAQPSGGGLTLTLATGTYNSTMTTQSLSVSFTASNAVAVGTDTNPAHNFSYTAGNGLVAVTVNSSGSTSGNICSISFVFTPS